MILLYLMLSVALSVGAAASGGDPSVEIRKGKAKGQVDIFFDGTLFTSFIQPKGVTKPVLWPVISSKGYAVTRSYPLKSVSGERTDHPHHIGIWLTYGDVNGIDYWNNSDAVPAEKKSQYGDIVSQGIISMTASGSEGKLVVKNQWTDNGEAVLDEITTFTFINRGEIRIIDRETRLIALKDVLFEDNKEGMIGMRMASELEMPSNSPVTLTDAHGMATTIKGVNERASGNYRSSEGLQGEDVWGTRGAWMTLSGNFNKDKVTVAMIDHPSNPGYPTYWHARGYGLYAANPLGQKALSDGQEELHYRLKKGEEGVFRYRIVISDDNTADEVNWSKLASEFSSN
ncbi:MAG TPA: PmoA family protein [Cyclobacteriaceae bacterium]|nr:PmoA family protein [Cyclobacteriaceae bacterium]